MPNLHKRSIQLGYKYFWDISQRDRASWKGFYRQDYEFRRPQGYTTAAGEKMLRGGIRSVKGPAKNTFNLQPKPPFVAQRSDDDQLALDYQKKRLFSWSLFHHGDETAAMFNIGNGSGIIPTSESTTTDGGGRGGPREVSREEGLKKFFWGMLRPPKNRPQLTKPENRGFPNTGFYKRGAQEAGSPFVADQIASDDSHSLLGKYQRDILPKAIWEMKKLTESRINHLLKIMPNVAGSTRGAQKTLGSMSEEELGIMVMELIGNLDGKTEEEAQEAVRNAVASYPRAQKRMEPGPQKVDIDPKYQPEAAAFLDEFMRNNVKLGAKFLTDLEAHKGGGYEVSQVRNRLQAYYKIQRSQFKSTQAMVNKIAKEMEADIRRHLAPGYKPSSGPLEGSGVGYGMVRRYHAGTKKHIYTTQMGKQGIAIYMVHITPQGVPAIIPYVWKGPEDTLLREMITSIGGKNVLTAVENELKAAQVSDLRLTGMGNIMIKSKLSTTLQKIDWLGYEDDKGFGGQLRGGYNIRNHVSTIAPQKLAKSIFDWVNKGAEAFGNMIDIKDNSELSQFMSENQQRAEKIASKADEMAMGGWKNWAEKLGGKDSPTPQEAPGWAQFLHPRPYIKSETFG